MDFAVAVMDFSITSDLPVHREEQFRTPSGPERAVGLWVDRIGASFNDYGRKRLRILGQFAAVRVDAGQGDFFSPATGPLPVHAGQAIILFPDEPHLYMPRNRWQTRWVVWNGPEAHNLLQLGYLAKDRAVIDDPLAAVADAHRRLQPNIHREDLAEILDRKNTILHMVLALFRSSRRSDQANAGPERIEPILAFLADHCADQTAIDELARHFNLSPPTLRRLFKTHTGRSPREFVTSLRISRAKELLAQGRPIKEVAATVGYDDQFYFMKVFKKTTGVPPGKFAFMTR